MNSMATNLTREVCTVEACVHTFHEVDRSDSESFAFHETASIGVDRDWEVSVTRFENERQWYVDARVRETLTVEDSLALADAIRLQAGVAYELSREMGK